jgi:hypothetical protein
MSGIICQDENITDGEKEYRNESPEGADKKGNLDPTTSIRV